MTVALILLVAILPLGFWVIKAAWNVIPLIAAAIATISMFRLDGLTLRYSILCCTLLWLINNILTGSISGTVMESMIRVMSSVTISRLQRETASDAVGDAQQSIERATLARYSRRRK